ncbi:CoA transferase [Microbacterium sp. NRRL B-14842]|uniref:CoA transferase n=1 Tax=Microbacterium sp. NRRL B-14842 TaxID=3162881 RepID=UPI003D2D200D
MPSCSAIVLRPWSAWALSPDALAARYPGLLVAQLSAWGTSHPERAGFDSLVQAESGIALIEGDGGRPGALPAQALDHSAGYLLAAALTQLLRHRDGHSRVVRDLLASDRAPICSGCRGRPARRRSPRWTHPVTWPASTSTGKRS